MRVEDEGMTLVGDIVGCPTWLANILASAYPSRSIEGFAGAKTVTGQHWDLIITDLALLGVSWPGVTTLEDLQALYSIDGPDGIEVKEEDLTIAARGATVQAQSALEKVRQAFVAALPDLDIPGWPWIRAILQDPNELIVDDDEGGLWMVAYDASNEDDIKFQSPVKKKIQYVNASQKRDPQARTLLTNMLTNDRTVVASWENRTASRPENDPGGQPMTPEQLRATLGLQADATDEQVQARIQELQAAAASPTPTPDQAGASGANGPGNPSDTPPVTQPATPPNPGQSGSATGEAGTPSPDQAGETGLKGPGSPSATPDVMQGQLPAGMVAVPADQWSAMQASVGHLTAAATTDRETSDIRDLDDAIKAGKVFPYQRDHYVARLKDTKTRDAYHHLITASVEQGGLMANMVPVTQRGADAPDSAQIEAAYPAEWLPEVQQPNRDQTVTMEA